MWCWKSDFQITCWASSEKVITYLLPSQANTNDTANVRTPVLTCISHSAVYPQYMHTKKQHCSKTKAFAEHITQCNGSIIQARTGLPILGKLLRHKKKHFKIKRNSTTSFWLNIRRARYDTETRMAWYWSNAVNAHSRHQHKKVKQANKRNSDRIALHAFFHEKKESNNIWYHFLSRKSYELRLDLAATKSASLENSVTR